MSLVELMATGPKQRSVSQLLEYLECQEKYRLKRRVKVGELPSIWKPAGNAFHEAIASFGEAYFYGVAEEPEYYATQFRSLFNDELLADADASGIAVKDFEKSGVTKDRPDGYDEAWWLENGSVMVLEYVKWLADGGYEILDLDGKPAVELEFTFPFEGVPIRGYVDLVVKDKDGNVLVVDAKTGVRMPNAIQLGVYAAVLEQQYGLNVPYGAYYKARESKLLKPKLLTYLKDFANLSRGFRMMDTSERSGIYIPSLSEDCERCMVRSSCQYYNQTWESA